MATRRLGACGLVLVVSLLLAEANPEPALAQPVDKPITNSIGMKLALVPAGKFRMGSPAEEAERDTDEAAHEVAITKPFYLGVYEVTQREYEKVIGKNPSFFRVGLDSPADHPVEQVRWVEAAAFCQKLSDLADERKAGRTYRLPTEAEWEYACRAGTTTAFHFGRSLSSKQANFNGTAPYGGADKGPYLRTTAKVGSYPPNAWGLYEMHGNVAEWCADWYDAQYYAKSPKQDPPGPAEGVLPTGFRNEFYKVARGGCWLDEGRGCRSAYRFRFMTTDPYRWVGFRVVCVPGEKAP